MNANRRGKFALVKEMDLVSGHVQGHRDGFGFLIPDDEGTDIFLPLHHIGLYRSSVQTFTNML